MRTRENLARRRIKARKVKTVGARRLWGNFEQIIRSRASQKAVINQYHSRLGAKRVRNHKIKNWLVVSGQSGTIQERCRTQVW